MEDINSILSKSRFKMYKTAYKRYAGTVGRRRTSYG